MESNHTFRNPKRAYQSRSSLPLYDYYAGYTTDFVEDVIRYLELSPGSIVLDPWNGSGTTSLTSTLLGYQSKGYDINPAMLLVAKARLLDPSVHTSLESIAHDIVTKARRFSRFSWIPEDPLNTWLMPNTTLIFRKLERAIQVLLFPEGSRGPLIEMENLEPISSLAAYFYVALFRVSRKILGPFKGTNPTWIKSSHKDNIHIELEQGEIYKEFLSTVVNMNIQLMQNWILNSNATRVPLELGVANSDTLPLYDQQVDAVITSPPYCTRIDYAIATLPELYILGYSAKSLRGLRMQMIGTPTIRPIAPKPQSNWGEPCLSTLESIMRHGSKSSISYYYKHYIQYFDSMYASLTEIDRTLKSGGSCTLVVQNSYYKEVHVDLAAIFTTMAKSLNWSLAKRDDFVSGRTYATINSQSNRYTNKRSTIESALTFRK